MHVLLMLTVLILMAVLSVAVTLVTVVMDPCLVVVCMITKYFYFFLYCFFFVFTDIDECFSMPCGNNSVCLNTDGSFECSCLSGFTGDGFSCEG